MKRNNAEERIQVAVADNLRQRAEPGVVWWHTPNGGDRGAIGGARMKRMGLRAGVSDICVLRNGEFFALELKAPKGRATETQLEFISDVNRAGGYACVAEGQDEAIAILEAWGVLRRDQSRRPA